MFHDDSWSIDSSSTSDLNANVQRIVLHVYDDESKEFTSLTTYHGMIRIYTSQTWPSRIFWTFVVVSCLILFMTQTGWLLSFYNSHPTTYKLESYPLSSKLLPNISFCPSGFKHNDYLYNLIFDDEQNSDFSNSIDTKLAVEKYSYNCQDIIKDVWLGNNKIPNFCHDVKTTITEAGKCFTFSNWHSFSSIKNIRIHFLKDFQEDLLILLDNSQKPSLHASTNFHIRPQTSSVFSFSIVEKSLLPSDDWGTCKSGNYEIGKCNINCLSNSLIESCGCQPFFSDVEGVRYCKIGDMRNCKKGKTKSCNCPVQCHTFEFLPKTLNVFKSTGMSLSIQMNSKIVNKYKQFKRVRQVDVMSYIGGLMGLFLGMSCVTLLEVFIYLFKTIFGQFNDLRHQNFVDGLLGNSHADDLHRSHEEIIITRNIEPNTSISNLEDDVSQIVPTVIGNRKMSLASDRGLKIQLYRPTLGNRRKSVYQEACDF